MNIQINHLAQAERSPEHVWGMALHGFMQSTEAVCELAKQQPYRDFAVDDLTKITEAALAVNLLWSQLKAREAA